MNIIDKAKKLPAYASLVFNKHYGDWLINHKKFKMVSYCPADMFFLQVKNSEFRRPDMIVRHLAIDNYYGNNDFGFDLYRKLQDARVKKGYADQAVKKFYTLIESYAKNGYDPNSYILADRELKLRDGSHRMAMATYLNLPEITVAVFNATTSLVLDYNWLLEHGFTKEEVDILRQKADSLRQEMNTPLKCIVWNRAKRDEICAVLKKHGTVLKCEDTALTAEQLKAVNDLYSTDYKSINCTVVDFQLEQPLYLPVKFAQQPVFAQTAESRKQLGSLNADVCMPQNFGENIKLAKILNN
ncbi:MAG: hypothetical protein E7483_06650 [Ruminococcaceae bacterium]|nr:hypothetical protein [Oscillospiraceae bacterium]